MKAVLLFLYITLLTFNLKAQDEFVTIESKLSRYNDYFINADKLEHRIFALDKFTFLFKSALEKENSFLYPFDSLFGISKLMPQDSSFRIFTWQFMKTPSEFEYYGYLQRRDGSLVSLEDSKIHYSDLEYEVFTPSDWFGQIYYNLYQYEKDGENQYILFGFKQIDYRSKIKTAIPIYFEGKKLFFGQSVFQDTLHKGENKNIIVLKTSGNAASSLNYNDEMGMIVFDHLITAMVPGRWGDIGKVSLVPDGSYHGYNWDGNKWIFIDRVFPQKYKEAPRKDSVIENRREKGWE